MEKVIPSSIADRSEPTSTLKLTSIHIAEPIAARIRLLSPATAKAVTNGLLKTEVVLDPELEKKVALLISTAALVTRPFSAMKL